jgi:CTP:molybdopterin cytidylyltransferase MocA
VHVAAPLANTSPRDKGARDLIAAARENILELPVGDSAIEIDIDTREDLRHGP